MDENDLVSAVCSHLERVGYRVSERRHTTQHGIDITAEHVESGRRLYVEAKGGTSSRDGSPRFGKPFTESQVFDRVAKGVFTALELRAKFPNRTDADVALAVPDEKWFRGYLVRVGQALNEAGISVLLVRSDWQVDHFQG